VSEETAMNSGTAASRLLRNALLALPVVLSLAGAGREVPADQTPKTDEIREYRKVDVRDVDVQAALKLALADQKRKSSGNEKLLSIVSAERRFVTPDNYRLCLSMNRRGRTELARVVLSRDAKKQWTVTLWSWGSCAP
jgi:hypothetical protein